MKAAPLAKLDACRRMFGDVIRLDSGPIPTIWLCDYEDISKTLKLDSVAGRPHKLMPGVTATKYVVCTVLGPLVSVLSSLVSVLSTLAFLFELGRLARPGRQTGIRLYWTVPAEGQNKSWGHRLTAKAIT
jgi:hypothetical protein